jgi:hypothetical protein
MRISGTGVGEPAGHRLHPSCFFFSSLEGGGKTRLGGELRREDQLLPRAGMSTDRDGTDDDLSKGVFHMPFLPSSGTTGSHNSRGQAGSTRPAQADQPR